jgi:hypothetical protein
MGASRLMVPMPTCPVLLRRTIAGEAVAEPCGMGLELVDDED